MNVKSKLLSFAVLFFLFVSGPIYSRGPWTNSEEKTTNSDGLWKNSVPDRQLLNNLNNDVNRGPADPPPVKPPGLETSPVSEGLAILSLLSGGYFILKKRNSKQLG